VVDLERIPDEVLPAGFDHSRGRTAVAVAAQVDEHSTGVRLGGVPLADDQDRAAQQRRRALDYEALKGWTRAARTQS